MGGSAEPARFALLSTDGAGGAIWLATGGIDDDWRRADAQRLVAGHWSLAHYRRTAFILIGIGLLIETPAMLLQIYTGWDFRWAGFFLQVPRELSAPVQAMGYAALCYGYWPVLINWKLTHAIQCVGRMALSNYLLQTLICTTLFNHFALFNRFDRLHLLMMVPAIWLINILFSILWLRFFRQGPLEALWRQLTLLGGGKPQEKNARKDDGCHKGYGIVCNRFH